MSSHLSLKPFVKHDILTLNFLEIEWQLTKEVKSPVSKFWLLFICRSTRVEQVLVQRPASGTWRGVAAERHGHAGREDQEVAEVEQPHGFGQHQFRMEKGDVRLIKSVQSGNSLPEMNILKTGRVLLVLSLFGPELKNRLVRRISKTNQEF